MFGQGLLKGLGVTLKHFRETFQDDRKKVPSRYQDSIQVGKYQRVMDQPLSQEGLLTIQYPEERRLLPERFRYIPMLIWDTEAGEDRCTACGICAKVCPPQCIWIVRDSDENGKPVTRPAEFYIDAAVCMSCSFCTEFCPFDAIKMNHDYELRRLRPLPAARLRQGGTDRAAGILRGLVADAVCRGAGAPPEGGGRGEGPRRGQGQGGRGESCCESRR